MFLLVSSNLEHNSGAASPDRDYVAVSDELVRFNVGDTYKTHTIFINDDTICDNTSRNIFSNIALSSGNQLIRVINPQATIIIDDSNEIDCSEF